MLNFDPLSTFNFQNAVLIWLVVTALLAVLKTGAVYALLDPAWPERRLRDVLGQLDAPLLIGTEKHAGLAKVWSPPPEDLPVPDGFHPAQVSAADPCCVFFTSGTTGRPKGVLSPHRATARLFPPAGRDAFVDIGPATVIPVAAPAPWDAFSLELWGALLNGATALLVDEPLDDMKSRFRRVRVTGSAGRSVDWQ